jgi:hypothetical protein
MATWLSGSAARSIAGRLRRAGVKVVTQPESFFVTRGAEPQLEVGEDVRAAAWASDLAGLVSPRKAVAA